MTNDIDAGCRAGCCVSMVGDVYKFLVTGDETSGNTFVMEGIIPPGGGPPLHVHSRESEGFYVVAGEFEIHHGSTVDRLGPTGFVQCQRGVAHRFQNVGSTTGRLLQVFAPAGIERFFYEAGTQVTDDRAPALPVGQADIARLLSAAARYGIEIRLPDHGDSSG